MARRAVWASGAALLAFAVPWLTFFVEPNDSAPWWTTWLPGSAWLVLATVGLTLLLSKGRRSVGAALLLGGVVGFGLFWLTIPAISAGG
jgi:hypothetical protein